MPYRLPPLNALRAFEAAARHLSFKNAALELSVTPTAVSHQIKLLEETLALPLFHRLTRSLELTTQGRAMLPKVREGLECFVAAVEMARVPDPHGRLTLVLPPSFATRWLVPRLRRFAVAEPSLNLHIVRSLKAIDGDQVADVASFEGLDLRQDDAVVVIRYGAGTYPGFQVDRIFGADYIAVCSPALTKGKRPLRKPEDMRHQVLLHDDATTSDKSGLGWDEWLKRAGISGVDSGSGPHFGDSGLVYVAALDGLGVALASKPLVANALAQGRLVAPFDIAVGQNYAYYLVIPQTIAQRPAVQAFRNWLLEEAGKEESGLPAH
ncbi:MAG: transcriptional regulator GcvA [Rhodoferax sp.]|jgi:LysR family glycine cleavage system transcriptional activator|nr:transcriptional regulator GcvA [Rhodoferax sp.]